MAKIGLTSGFTPIPEGTYIFKIAEVKYKEDFGKLEVTMQTQDGKKHIERFSLLKANGEPNEGALGAFSYFAKTALDDFSTEEVDPEDLVGHFMECDVEHDVQPNKNKPGKTVTFTRLAEKRPSDGWGGTAAPAVSASRAAPRSATKTAPGNKPAVDLAALLG